MSVTFPEFQVGQPVAHENLSVFPLFREVPNRVKYRLADEGIADKTVVVEEVDEAGSIPELLVRNMESVRVLFLEGEELVGAKQNRILNTSVLIAAGDEVRIPVSCVEQGRWGYRERRFRPSGSSPHSALRYAMKRAVTGSSKAGRGHRSDQSEVWMHVESLLCTAGVASDTRAMSDAYESLEDRIDAYRSKTPYVSGAVGLAVAIGSAVVMLDVFDKAETCRKAWDRILSGCVLEAITAGKQKGSVDTNDVIRHLDGVALAKWEQVKTVGEGEEFRAEIDQDHASVLTFSDTVVHGSLLTAV